MASNLHDRLRGIVQGARPAVPAVSPDLQAPAAPALARPSATASEQDLQRAAEILGGEVREGRDGLVMVVARDYPLEALHGRARVGDFVETIHGGHDARRTLSRAWPAASGIETAPGVDARLLFLDLETTGLAGGAGTQAFLIGCASLGDRGIRVTQFLLPGFEHERALLASLAALAGDTGALVTFNGRTFDVPLIETRFLFHRLPFPLDELPHLDMLHAARRLWRARPTTTGPDADATSCSLTTLEKQVAGLYRVGDVPGFEIPSRYFRFVREADARPLEAVLEHNRLDLVSTVAVMARAVTLITHGPSATSGPHEALGLARLYDRAGARDDAEAALCHAIAMARAVGTEPEVHGEALRRLAWLRRRDGRAQQAAEAWQELAGLPRCPAALRREAREALAIHHEHRSRDLGTARSLTLDLLGEAASHHQREAAEHRLKRLERKLGAAATGQLPLA